MPVEPRCRRRGEQAILAFDERGDFLEEDDERGLETREGDFAFLVGERVDSVHHVVVEGALPREHRGQPAMDDTEPGLVRAGRRRQHRVGPRHDRAGRFVGRDERVVDRRQRFVVDDAPRRRLPAAIDRCRSSAAIVTRRRGSRNALTIR